MSDRIVIRGEAYLAIETLAECFEVRVRWVREVYDRGLLGHGERRGESLYVEARMLDRMAEIRRLHALLDADLAAIELFLDALDEPVA